MISTQFESQHLSGYGGLGVSTVGVTCTSSNAALMLNYVILVFGAMYPAIQVVGFYREGLAYFRKTTSNQTLHVRQKHCSMIKGKKESLGAELIRMQPRHVTH